MISQLELRHHPASAHHPSAWFLPGNDPEVWLDALAQCGLALAGTQLFIVPRSVSDLQPAGVLVLPPKRTQPTRRPAAIACREIADKLHVPADASLFPPVTDAEVRLLCAFPVSFFHPSLGLSSFEEGAGLRVWDLLSPPEDSPRRWNCAQPGTAPLPELTNVGLVSPPSLQDLFGGAETDIGTESPLDLPKLADEPGTHPGARATRALRRLIAKGVAGAVRHLPQTASRRTWANDAEDWAHRQLRHLHQQLDQVRNKELHRLLRLLDADPEKGLRHALPLNRFAHRGIAPPGGRLGSRSLDFDPQHLGGEAADFWDVPPNLQEVLRRRYREMADREMQLGRHRRAAYVYAQLLGDLVSAANALKQGGHYREAALLYEEQLQNPVEAARCLVEAGLLQEAIERFEKLERWLDVADLQERLGNSDAAAAAVRKVIDERIGHGDLLGAAKLVKERLKNTEEALELLLQAWPGSGQSVTCLSEAFDLMGSQGEHAHSLERLATFRRETVPEAHLLPLLTLLGRLTLKYPHAVVRHVAADLSRMLIADELRRPDLSSEQVRQLTQNLSRLAPHDRLVSRDASRYLAEHRAARLARRRKKPPPVLGNDPEVIRTLELPRNLEWLRLRRDVHWFYAVGITPNSITVIRGVWTGEHQSLTWKCSATAARRGALVLEPTEEGGRALAFGLVDGKSLEEKRFPASDLFFSQECAVGLPSWMSSEHFPVAFGSQSIWTCHMASGSVVLSCYDKSGQLQHTVDVSEALLKDGERLPGSPLCLATIENDAAIAIGNRLVLAQGAHQITQVDLPNQARSLAATGAHTRKGIAVMMEHGAVLHWLGMPDLVELSRDLHQPMGAFVPGGKLALISKTSMQVLGVDSRGVHTSTRMELEGQDAIGICAGDGFGEVAVLGNRGQMTLFRVN